MPPAVPSPPRGPSLARPAGVAAGDPDEQPGGEAGHEALALVAGRARDGDEVAFRQLIQLTTDRLFRIAAHLTGDRDEADDVVQETFIRAWGRMGELREPAAVLGWLARIARNAARDRLRTRRRRGEDRRDDPRHEPEAAPGGRPDEHLAAAQLAVAVRRAVGQLADKHRVVLLLREVDGMSYDQIAQLLELPVGTVESRLHRARAALARRLARARREGGLP
jgi:RNA polymerase sigma-70 factor, ECF subfamily